MEVLRGTGHGEPVVSMSDAMGTEPLKNGSSMQGAESDVMAAKAAVKTYVG